MWEESTQHHMDRSSPSKTVKAVETTFRILDVLRKLDGAGVTEVANHANVSKGTAYNHLMTLEQQQYVVKDEDGTYNVGLRFADMGHYARSRFAISQLVEDEVDTLAEQSGEMALFSIEEHGQAVCLHVAYGDHAVRTPLHIGYREDLHTTAVGKAILAHKPREEAERIIERRGLHEVTENTITDRETLFDDLDRIREQGIAFNHQETIHGLVGVGVPVKSQDGTVAGAVSVIGPSSRMDEDRLEHDLPELLMKSVNIIEVNTTSL
jgi:DNA-binding IclR family transcriptional regulator